MNQEFKRDQVVFSRSGCSSKYVEQLNVNQHLVEVEEDEFEVWTEVFLSDPTEARISPLLKDAEAKLAMLQKSISEAHAELRRVTNEIQGVKSGLKDLPAYQRILDFKEGSFKFLVLLNSYVAHEILELPKEGIPTGGHMGTKLVCLFGKSNGDMLWEINSYSDGSGNWVECVPCKSMEEALEIIKVQFEEALAKWKSGCQTRGDSWLDSTAQKYNLELPERYVWVRNKSKIAYLEKCIEECEVKLDADRVLLKGLKNAR